MVGTDKFQALYDLGLSKNEVESYIKLLEIGEATAAHVAKESKLHRPNVYDALDKLVKRGLVSYSVNNDTKYYQANDPSQLLTFVKSRELALQQLIPQLEVMRLSAKEPSRVSTYEGIQGARMMLSEILEHSTEIFALSLAKDFAKMTGEGWAKEWHEKRVAKKILFKHLMNHDYYPHRIAYARSLPYTECRFIPKEYQTPLSLFIYDKGIVMFFLNPLVSIKIVGEEVAKSYKNYYGLIEKVSLAEPPTD